MRAAAATFAAALTAALTAQHEPGLTRAAAEALLPQLVDEHRDAARQAGRDTLPTPTTTLTADAAPPVLRLGDYSMPFVLLQKGERPAGGWPLFLCLHGGGGNAKASGPHGWDVNDREWQAQQTLWRRLYPSPGLYFIPRMADDRRGRWYHDHNQIAFEQVIREAILFHGVDANRVYLMGISEGGYGAIRFAGNRPDRFAATGAMAAAEPASTSPPENMRNVATRIDIGEQDTMFDRVGLARRLGERLAELQQADVGGYDFVVHVQAGRGHGIDYSLTPAWLVNKVRNPRPRRVPWLVTPFDSRVALQHYWLALREPPAAMPLFLDATIEQNRLVIRAERRDEAAATAMLTGTLLVRLDDQLADLDRPLSLTVNGVDRGEVRLQRRREVLARTLAERDDPSFAFSAELEVDLAAPR
ncbi:MAG: hypothetical protein IT455_15460 [Planctomycetes bacterium]|nr:hypothetical protein [Planctomycetota bacterium]